MWALLTHYFVLLSKLYYSNSFICAFELIVKRCLAKRRELSYSVTLFIITVTVALSWQIIKANIICVWILCANLKLIIQFHSVYTMCAKYFRTYKNWIELTMIWIEFAILFVSFILCCAVSLHNLYFQDLK